MGDLTWFSHENEDIPGLMGKLVGEFVVETLIFDGPKTRFPVSSFP
jgi:hypothetical protein